MKKDTIGTLYVLMAGILWGTMGVFVNYFDSIGLGSIDIAGVRVFFASILVVLFIAIKDPRLLKIKLKDIWCFIGSGLISLMIFTVCYFRTIVLASMSVAAVLLYTSPVFVIVLSFIIFKEKITKLKALSCIVCVAGSAFVSGVVGSDTKISLIAFLLGISSGFAYALYSIFSRFALQKHYPSITITAYTFFFATVGLFFLVDLPTIASSILTKPSNCVIMLLSGLITAVLPYLLYTMGLERIESGKAAVVAAIEPVVAVILGGVIFRDKLSIIQYFGIALVILSIAIQNIKQKTFKEKTTMARIKFGMMASYSGYEGNLEKMFSDAAEIGIDSLMINIHATDEFKAKMLADAPKIKEYSEKYGVEINALWASWGAPCFWNFYEGQNTIGLIPPEYRDRRMQRVLNASEVGQALGVKYIVTHCGYIPENPLDPVYTSFISMMKYICGVMKTRDQWFCLETGQETPITLLRTIQDIGTGNVGLNLDTANVILYGKANPVDAIKIVGDYVKCLHLKDGFWPTDGHNLGQQTKIGTGDVDFPAVIKGLNEHGYRGHFTIECERGATDERKYEILDSKNMFMDLTAQYEWDPE